MKKLKVLSIALIGMSVAFSSCSKDEKDKVNAPDTLTGTSWLYEGEVDGVHIGLELDFKTANACELAVMAGVEAEDVIAVVGGSLGTGTYTYTKPNVTIKIDGDEAKGVVDGNKLTLTIDDDQVVFIKE